MKIFVIHYKKLVDRKKHIIQQFAKFNMKNYEFIDIRVYAQIFWVRVPVSS